MSRLIQIIRNSFIRLEGLLYQLRAFFNKLFGLLNQLFNFLSKLFGFSSSQYFLETDSAKEIKQALASPDKPTPAPQNSPEPNRATRRNSDANMDYFLKMARQMPRQKKTSS